jgi:hypothetical protein
MRGRGGEGGGGIESKGGEAILVSSATGELFRIGVGFVSPSTATMTSLPLPFQGERSSRLLLFVRSCNVPDELRRREDIDGSPSFLCARISAKREGLGLASGRLRDDDASEDAV